MNPLGDDLLAWLVLALGGALLVGNVMAIVRPPARPLEEGALPARADRPQRDHGADRGHLRHLGARLPGDVGLVPAAGTRNHAPRRRWFSVVGPG